MSDELTEKNEGQLRCFFCKNIFTRSDTSNAKVMGRGYIHPECFSLYSERVQIAFGCHEFRIEIHELFPTKFTMENLCREPQKTEEFIMNNSKIKDENEHDYN